MKRIQNIAKAKWHHRKESEEDCSAPEMDWKIPHEEPSRAQREAMALAKDYETLELEIGASDDEIHAAYRKLLKKYHPDRFANDAVKLKQATQLSAEINSAYQRLKKFKAGEKKNSAG